MIWLTMYCFLSTFLITLIFYATQTDLNMNDSDAAAFESVQPKKPDIDSHTMQGLLLSLCPLIITLKTVR